jgi:hypothetical protein
MTVCAYSTNAPVTSPMVSVAPVSDVVRRRSLTGMQPRHAERVNS